MTARLTSISSDSTHRRASVTALGFASTLRDPEVSTAEATRIDQSWAASIQRVCGHTADEKGTTRVRSDH